MNKKNRIYSASLLRLTLLLLFGVLSCKKMEYHDYSSLDGIKISPSHVMSLKMDSKIVPQGGDCYGNLYFQFTSNNSIVRVYDLEKKILIQESEIEGFNRGFVSRCHCNSVNFSSSYYSDEDEFPLIYVSTGYSSGGYTGALVYRIQREQSMFSFSLVQTLKFPVFESLVWTEFIPADRFCYLCYTGANVVFKFYLPSINEGDVYLNYIDAIDSFQFPSQTEWINNSSNQDRLYYNEKIISISGVPHSGESLFLAIMDLSSRTYEHIFDLKAMGLYQEPESVFFWKNNLCIAFLDEIVQFVFSTNVF